jgi:hypothetical protein
MDAVFNWIKPGQFLGKGSFNGHWISAYFYKTVLFFKQVNWIGVFPGMVSNRRILEKEEVD